MARMQLSDRDHNNQARILNLPSPTSPSEPATKGYVDSAVEGIAWKDNARVATQANINLAAPGATVDGETMALGNRIVVRAQTAQPENGIYVWNGAAVPATRSLDANTFEELESAVVTVDAGTSAGSSYRQTSVGGTLGSTNVVWVSFGVAAPESSETVRGLSEAATQAETDAGALDAPYYVSPAKLAAWPGRARRVMQNIGDGSATQFTVTHNLGTRDVDVTVRRTAAPYDEVDVDAEADTTNSVVIRFAAAPTASQFRVKVSG